jgi:hypothetical protein
MIDTSTNGATHPPVNRVRARSRKRASRIDDAAPKPPPANDRVEQPATATSAGAAHEALPDEANDGRDAQGRFARGNPGGPGNPFARQVAQLRRALCNSVTDEDVQEVSRQLLAQAKQGDVASARLLFGYTIGRPAAAVDPDRLDFDEWDIHRRTPTRTDEIQAILGGIPVTVACELFTAIAPYLHERMAQAFVDGLRMDDAAFGELVARATARAHGLEIPEPDDAPSTNAAKPKPASPGTQGSSTRDDADQAAPSDTPSPRPRTAPAEMPEGPAPTSDGAPLTPPTLPVNKDSEKAFAVGTQQPCRQ